MYATATTEDRMSRATAMLTYVKEMEQNLLDSSMASGQRQVTFSMEAMAGLQALHELMAEILKPQEEQA